MKIDSVEFIEFMNAPKLKIFSVSDSKITNFKAFNRMNLT